MKPLLDRLVVVTASINPERAAACLQSWTDRAHYSLHTIVVWNGALDTNGMTADQANLSRAWAPEFDRQYPGTTFLVRPEILGVVPAFALGVAAALKMGAEIIACFHDDLLIEEENWDLKVLGHFDEHPKCGLAGFGGGEGLADVDIYQKPYAPHQLARKSFVSNMRDAEAHGARVPLARRVACLDGFSAIGRRKFWTELTPTTSSHEYNEGYDATSNLFTIMAEWGLVHHAYDAALGAFAKRLGWQAWMLPIACHHFGGMTAVAEPRYAEWAKTITPKGDADFWEMAHHEIYTRFRDVLPIRI